MAQRALRQIKAAARGFVRFSFCVCFCALFCAGSPAAKRLAAQAARKPAAPPLAAPALAPPQAYYGPPLPLKRKFISRGVLKPRIKLPPPQKPDFPLFSNAVFVPKFFDSHERFERADLSALSRLRFLVSADFFPFNYRTANGDLAGYNIDLARALCAELRVENICRIEAAPWETLPSRLQAGEADALLAGLAPSGQNRAFLQFTRAYMRFPARFIALEGSAAAAQSRAFTRQGYDFSEFALLRGASLTVGVISGTAHEQMLKAYFKARAAKPGAAAPRPRAVPPQFFYRSSYRSGGAENYAAGGKNALRYVACADGAALLAALSKGQIDLAFGDGMNFALLINRQNAAQSAPPAAAAASAPSVSAAANGANAAPAPRLVFLGGAYMGIGYLGQGMRIAVRQDLPQLKDALNYALQQLERKGRLSELYLRYFPVGFY